MNKDFHLDVTGCGGQLTLRPYTVITAGSDGDGGSGAVYGDLITLCPFPAPDRQVRSTFRVFPDAPGPGSQPPWIP
ncbi:MspA family porin [Nocardia acidivorans]|uniref:MspA family porin n=1 Tax=Nocardia acidivorans TaxID=404580 RepID=UPI000B2FD601|nr:MspA family porin [Nocardia acidivorans]